jgi:23S rRNA (guanosine2251-2'-O)-methyltransferase
MREWIYGRNPVWETLAADRRQAFELRIAQGVRETETITRIREHCLDRKIPINYPSREELDGMGVSHQGLALLVGGYPYVPAADFYQAAGRAGAPPFFLILDMLQDPQNLGSLLRTAEAAGVQGVLIPSRRSAHVTPAVVSASSGASEHLHIARANLVAGLKALKEAGIFIYGLAQGEGTVPLGQARLDGPIGLAVGNEGQGLRRLVRETCDVLVEIPMQGQVGSLNAAVAGSVALYFILQARRQLG